MQDRHHQHRGSKLDIGLVYQHGAKAKFRGDFRLDMDDDFFTEDLAAQGLQYPPLVEGKAEISLRLPKRTTLGFGYDVHPRFRVEAMGQYVFYQDFDQIDIELKSPDLAQPSLGVGDTVHQPLVRDWVGAGIVEFTGKIDATDKLGLTVMAGYHSPASPDSTVDIASPDGQRIVYGAGLGYAFSEQFTLLLDLEGHSILPRTVTGSDYDRGNGVYRLFILHVGLAAQAKFGPRGVQKRSADSPPAKPSEPEATGPEREPASAKPAAAPATAEPVESRSKGSNVGPTGHSPPPPPPVPPS